MAYNQQAVGSSPTAPTETLTWIFAVAIGTVREPWSRWTKVGCQLDLFCGRPAAFSRLRAVEAGSRSSSAKGHLWRGDDPCRSLAPVGSGPRTEPPASAARRYRRRPQRRGRLPGPDSSVGDRLGAHWHICTRHHRRCARCDRRSGDVTAAEALDGLGATLEHLRWFSLMNRAFLDMTGIPDTTRSTSTSGLDCTLARRQGSRWWEHLCRFRQLLRHGPALRQ